MVFSFGHDKARPRKWDRAEVLVLIGQVSGSASSSKQTNVIPASMTQHGQGA